MTATLLYYTLTCSILNTSSSKDKFVFFLTMFMQRNVPDTSVGYYKIECVVWPVWLFILPHALQGLLLLHEKSI